MQNINSQRTRPFTSSISLRWLPLIALLLLLIAQGNVAEAAPVATEPTHIGGVCNNADFPILVTSTINDQQYELRTIQSHQCSHRNNEDEDVEAVWGKVCNGSICERIGYKLGFSYLLGNPCWLASAPNSGQQHIRLTHPYPTCPVQNDRWVIADDITRWTSQGAVPNLSQISYTLDVNGSSPATPVLPTPTRTSTRTATITNTPPRPPATATAPPSGGSFTLTNPSYSVSGNRTFNATIHLHSNSFYFSGIPGGRGDLLKRLDDLYGAFPHVNIQGNVGPGQGQDLNFTLTAPPGQGTYTSRWQMWVGGVPVGPIATVTFSVGSPPPPPSGWHYQAYSNRHLAGGMCQELWLDKYYVWENWGYSPPGPNCPANEFSVRLTKNVYFEGGSYSFHVDHQDGARLYVDGTLIIDAWWTGDGGHDMERTLSQGNHEIKVEYYNDQDQALVAAWWYGAGALPYDQRPWGNVPLTHWRAYYYYTDNFYMTPPLVVDEGTGFIDHSWGGGFVGYQLPNDNVSVSFYRQVSFACGRYTFSGNADDGFQLKVGSQMVIDLLGSSVGAWSRQVDIAGGDLILDAKYRENSGNAHVRFQWELTAPCTPTPTPTSAVPDPPPSVQGTTTTVDTVSLGWGSVAGAIGYRVYRWDGIQFALVAELASSATDFTDTSLPCGTALTYLVRSLNVNGESSDSNQADVTTTACPSVTPCTSSFSDVPTSHIFYSDILFLACRGVISGLPNGNGTFRFEPSSPTTRGQFAKVATLGFALPSYTPGSPTFSDVPQNNVFYPFVEAAARAGAITGFTPQQCVGAGTPVPNQPCFRPNQNVTRAQVAIITQRARGYPALTPPTPTFSDVPTTNFAYTAIETLAGRGIINGAVCPAPQTGQCFRPNENIRRGELSKVVRRVVESIP